MCVCVCVCVVCVNISLQALWEQTVVLLMESRIQFDGYIVGNGYLVTTHVHMPIFGCSYVE